MDAREALRRYLEQRKELGESELVLDSLSVEEALRLVGAAGKGRKPHGGDDVSITSSDWRAALREAGATPDAHTTARARPADTAPSKPSPQAKEAVHVPDTQSAPGAASLQSPIEGVPTGIVIAGASRVVADDPAFKLDTLQEIAEAVAKCTRCPLYATAKNPVPGAGNPNADLMLVGEAPGANEDEQGVPLWARPASS